MLGVFLIKSKTPSSTFVNAKSCFPNINFLCLINSNFSTGSPYFKKTSMSILSSDSLLKCSHLLNAAPVAESVATISPPSTGALPIIARTSFLVRLFNTLVEISGLSAFKSFTTELTCALVSNGSRPTISLISSLVKILIKVASPNEGIIGSIGIILNLPLTGANKLYIFSCTFWRGVTYVF